MRIEKESINLVKNFLDLGVKIRHVKNLAPINFAVSNHGLIATVEEMDNGQMVQNLLTSNEFTYIKHFSSMFEQLWKGGLDARHRIKNIEDNVDFADIEIIQNPMESIIRRRYMVISANKKLN